jgi:transcriptional regulator with XRE-family HTH domain
MKLNTKLRKLRNSIKLSQAELAEALQISQTAYNKWESGTTKPSLDNILKLSQFYKIYIEELIDESPSVQLILQKRNQNNGRGYFYNYPKSE